MFFNNIQKNQPAANVDQQSTVKSTPESTLCVELSDEELCAVNGGSLSGFAERGSCASGSASYGCGRS
jgi:hypothetical protein